MSLLEKLKVWALTGAKVQPDDSDIFDGWGYLERPPRQHWNWVEYTRDTRINDLIDSILAGRTGSPIVTPGGLCSRQMTQWSEPRSFPNYLVSGVDVIDSTLAWDYTNKKPQILVLQDTGEIKPLTGCWDYSASPVLGADLGLVYPSTPDDIFCICSDATDLYVVWGTAGNNISMSKFSLITFTGNAVWTGDLGVPYDDLISGLTKCCIGNSDRVVTMAWESDHGTICSTLKSTGATISGHGTSVLSGESMDARGAEVVSDGTCAFWVSRTGSDPYAWALQSALISDPTTSPHSLEDIVSTPAADTHLFPYGIAVIRSRVVMADMTANFYLYSTSKGAVYKILELDDTDTTTLGDTLAPLLASDGMNAWLFRLGAYAVEAGDRAYAFHKVPDGMFNVRARIAVPPRTLKLPAIYINESNRQNETLMGRLLFDGQDMWLIAWDGSFYRITSPGLR